MDELIIQDRVRRLKNNSMFFDLSDSSLIRLASNLTERIYSAKEFIIRESIPGRDEFYLIKSGQVEILKEITEGEDQVDIHIATLSQGETIGETALMQDVPRSASARALTEVEILVIPVKLLREFSSHTVYYDLIKKQLDKLLEDLSAPPVYATVALNLAKKLSNRLLSTNFRTALALKEELKLSQIRAATGSFLITVISLIVLYTFCMSTINVFIKSLPSTTIIAMPMLAIFSLAIIHLMFTSGYPISHYGVTTKNWKKSVLESMIFSLPVLLIIVIIKWVLVEETSLFPSVFEGLNRAYPPTLNTWIKISLSLIYILMVPLQEVIARGAIQGSLQHFLTSKHKMLIAIIMSNLIFAMTHLHISLFVGLTVFFFGLFWGWLYSRQGTLVGVSVSHMIIGGFGLFVVGFF